MYVNYTVKQIKRNINYFLAILEINSRLNCIAVIVTANKIILMH